MNFVTSVFKKYINKNDVKQGQESDKPEKALAQRINETGKPFISKESAASTSGESHSTNNAFLNDDEDSFQDAETNVTSNNFFLSEEAKASSAMQDNERESISILPHTSFAQTTNNDLENGISNTKDDSHIISHSSPITEPDSLNNSMFDSLEVSNTREMIDSIEILQHNSEESLSEPILDDLEAEEYKSLDPLANESVENISNVEKYTSATNEKILSQDIKKLESTDVTIIKSQDKLVSLSDILFDSPQKNPTISYEHDSKTDTQSTGALETLIQNVNQTFVINNQENELHQLSLVHEPSPKENQTESNKINLNEKSTTESKYTDVIADSKISDAEPNVLRNNGEQILIVTGETKNSGNQAEGNVQVFKTENPTELKKQVLKANLSIIKPNQLLEDSKSEHNNKESKNQESGQGELVANDENPNIRDESKLLSTLQQEEVTLANVAKEQIPLEPAGSCMETKPKPDDSKTQSDKKELREMAIKGKNCETITEREKTQKSKQLEGVFKPPKSEMKVQVPKGNTKNLIVENTLNTKKLNNPEIDIKQEKITADKDKENKLIAAQSKEIENQDRNNCSLIQKSFSAISNDTNTNNGKETDDNKGLENLDRKCANQSNKTYSRQDTFELLEKQCAESTEFNTECILDGLTSTTSTNQKCNQKMIKSEAKQFEELSESQIFNKHDTKEFELMERQYAEHVNDVNECVEKNEENIISFNRQETQEFENLEKQCQDNIKNQNRITDDILEALVAQTVDNMESIKPNTFSVDEKGNNKDLQILESINNTNISFENQESKDINHQIITTENIPETLVKQSIDHQEIGVNEDTIIVKANQTENECSNLIVIEKHLQTSKIVSSEIEQNEIAFNRQDTQEFENLEKKCQDTGDNRKNMTDDNSLNYQKIKVKEDTIVKTDHQENECSNVENLQISKIVDGEIEKNTIVFNRQDTQEFENLEKKCQSADDNLKNTIDGILETLAVQNSTSNENLNPQTIKLNGKEQGDILQILDTVEKENNNDLLNSSKNAIETQNIVSNTQENIAESADYNENMDSRELTENAEETAKSSEMTDNSEMTKNIETKQVPEKENVLEIQCNSNLETTLLNNENVSNQALEDKLHNNDIDENSQLYGHVNQEFIKSANSKGPANDVMEINVSDDTQKTLINTKKSKIEPVENNNLHRANIKTSPNKTKPISSSTVRQAQEIPPEKYSNQIHKNHANKSEELKNKVDLLQQELDSVRKLNKRKKQSILTSSIIEKEDKDTIFKYKNILKEYEKKIAQQNKDLDKLKMDMEQNVRNFTNTEMAFSDLFEKYEKAKFVIGAYGRNEDILLGNIKNAEEQLSQIENKCLSMKQQSMEQIKWAHKQVEQEKRKYKQEIAKLQAQVKRLEIKASSLETEVKQKTNECQALAALCDDITGRN